MLSGKVAIVTGSSRGIGRAMAIAMGRGGASVMVTHYREEGANGEETCKQVVAAGGKAALSRVDVTKVAELEHLIAKAVDRFGRLDIMINNAGFETRTGVLDSSEEDFDQVVAINLRGAFFGTQLAARQMIRQGQGGCIINISSIHEEWPMPGNAPYCSAKAGVGMLTRNAGVELARHGIRVVGVAPGAIATHMNEPVLDDPEKRRALEESIPAGRIGRPEEVADLVVYLASEEARYVTATTVFIDGGMMQKSPGL